MTEDSQFPSGYLQKHVITWGDSVTVSILEKVFKN